MSYRGRRGEGPTPGKVMAKTPNGPCHPSSSMQESLALVAGSGRTPAPPSGPQSRALFNS
jgi:hypothetical protein